MATVSRTLASAPTIFSACVPKEDVLLGTMADAEFAADLAQVLRGDAPPQYSDPQRFFSNTYPTRGLKDLLSNVCARLSKGQGVASIFRLDTSYGGGKTHGLIALVHAVRNGRTIPDIAEFVDPALLPTEHVRIAAYDGENADPSNGRRMGTELLAYTPWGEIAYQLAGPEGYERLRKSDETRGAPGADTLRELFGGEPTLILLDELSVYLRKVQSMSAARDQLTAFLTALFKAVESTPNAVLVYTLAVGRDGKAQDAYTQENQFLAEKMAEAESVSARKATLLNPTEDDETVLVLRRRLFESIDEGAAGKTVDAYRTLWNAQRGSIPDEALRPEIVDAFRRSYPFHPEVLDTLTGKTSTLANFQRVRGMLRLLARTVGHLWKTQPADATAIHVHHIDPGFGPIHQEFITRLNLQIYNPAIRNDISGEANRTALAQEIDATFYRGLPPYASYVARTIFLHSLGFPAQIQGIAPDHLRFSILAPSLDIGFIEDARKRFQERSAYLDDKPGAPLRFLTDANLTQILERQIQLCDPGEVRSELSSRIRSLYLNGDFQLVPFPAAPADVPDEIGSGKPLLVLMSYDSVSVGTTVDAVPELIARLHKNVGADSTGFRKLRNNLIFIVAEEAKINEMRREMARFLALQELVKPQRLQELAHHQQNTLLEWSRKAGGSVNTAIQLCYRHIFYPSRQALSPDTELAHSAIEVHRNDTLDNGQRPPTQVLRDSNKLRLPEDTPDSPSFVRDRTPLRKGQISTFDLRAEFRRDPSLPILIGDTPFTRGIQNGVERGEYVYRYRDLLFGQGDPYTHITITDDAFVFTMTYAREHGIWPRPKPTPTAPISASTLADLRSTSEGASVVASLTPAEQPASKMPDDSQRLQGTFTHEGVLREALRVVWEKAHSARVTQIVLLSIRLFEPADAFKMLAVVGGIPGAKVRVGFEGHYGTEAGGEFEYNFQGPVEDALPVKDFLGPQYRAAVDRDFRASFQLSFVNGLALEGDATDKLTERLTQQSMGAAYVTASAEAQK
ncbi:MAG: DUF499 domain-containing protein [Acidobacteriaceae bacterium]